MVQFTLNVEIDDAQLSTLPQDIKLCVTREVNGISNVVWIGRPLNQLSKKNTLKWTEEYQVFASSKFKAGELVKAESHSRGIQYGQKATYTAEGVMSAPVADTTIVGNKFCIHNERPDVCFGVHGRIDGAWFPVFVFPTAVKVQTNVSFTPINKVTVFWSKECGTGVMFFDASKPKIVVDFGTQSTQTVSFTGPPSGGQFVPGPLPGA
ncbi:hypothetical protein CVT24_003261 [Panaeolus cyanescens]|uniref:Uncharacterized protein n=1 Tax=Panaeolus cyanescens TaxID=181874 RepID=A0A409YXK2_9AGAR|nr:hypothetical protein CVT24_003261 [Panaeolus cyanescens]